jgi:hypothetical protein
MPTTDPVKRRSQNRENQARFRQRQSRQIAELHESFAQQSKTILDLQATVARLNEEKANALAEVARLNSHNNKLTSQIAGLSSFAKSWHETAEQAVCSNGEVVKPEHDYRGASVVTEILDDQQLRPWREAHTPTQLLAFTEPPVISTFFPNAQALECSYDSSGFMERDSSNSDSDGVPELTDDDLVENSSSWDSLSANSDTDQSLVTFGNQQNNNMAPISNGFSGIFSRTFAGYEPQLGYNLRNFPVTSRISKHINAVNKMLREELPVPQMYKPSLNPIVGTAISWMIRQSWPSSGDCLKFMSVYKQFFCYELWRNFPCRSTYENIHPQFRPTPLQLTVKHHPAIDWLPWPQLRNKAIELQDEIDIDLLNMTALQHTIFERVPQLQGADLDHFEPGRIPEATSTASFRAWDMYLLEKVATGQAFSDDQMVHKPKSPHVVALLNAYHLEHDDISRLRLERSFFDIFPQLWLPELVSTCEASVLLPSPDETLEYPSDLSGEGLRQLKKNISCAVQAVQGMGGTQSQQGIGAHSGGWEICV